MNKIASFLKPVGLSLSICWLIKLSQTPLTRYLAKLHQKQWNLLHPMFFLGWFIMFMAINWRARGLLMTQLISDKEFICLKASLNRFLTTIKDLAPKNL